MKLLPLLSCILLASCGQPADGHRFERKEFERTRPNISIVLHASLADLRAKAPAAARKPHLKAWSIIRADSCEVHLVDPVVAYEPQWLGHEVTHCVWGRFHP